jgi:hypothetical protein
MQTKNYKSNVLINVIFCLLLFTGVLTVLAAPVSAQYEFDNSISSQEQRQIDEMMKPVDKIFNLISYIYGAIAVLMIFYAAIIYLTAQGSDEKINRAKNTLTGVFLGGIVFIGAPKIIPYLLG